MKALYRNLLAGIIVVVTAVTLILAFNFVAPAISTTSLASLLTPARLFAPPPGEPIPIESIAELDAFEATVRLEVNGLIDGERTQGDLTGKLAVNPQNKSQITVSGPLLGDLAAKVGGSLVGLFTPSKVDLYKTPDGAYIVINGLVPVCIKPQALNATDTLDKMSPQWLMEMLTSSDVARGELVGQETINGAKVNHYVIDGDAFLAAAQESSNEELQKFAELLWAAEDAHVYVDVASGYPVAFRGNFSGEYEPLKFQGDFGIELDLTRIGKSAKVSLPRACNRPISK
ncbi:MAG: hypothetical protein J5I90_14085 [Caldilineales bacterium]|nr:hypothetical protein [Caldilineales bacterium]